MDIETRAHALFHPKCSVPFPYLQELPPLQACFSRTSLAYTSTTKNESSRHCLVFHAHTTLSRP